MGNQLPKLNQNKFGLEEWKQILIPSRHERKLLVSINNPNLFIEDSCAQVYSGSEQKNGHLLCQMSSQSEQLVSIKHFKLENVDRVCSKTCIAHLYTERIDLKLSDVGNINFPDILHVYHQCLVGYEKLKRIFGCFQVNQNFIAISQETKVKVWFRQNYSCLFPSEPTNLQDQMINSILRSIDKHINVYSMPKNEPSISSFILRNNKIDFFQAKKRLLQYSQLFNNGCIPNRLVYFELKQRFQQVKKPMSYKQQRVKSQQNYIIFTAPQMKPYNFLQNAIKQPPQYQILAQQKNQNFLIDSINRNNSRPSMYNVLSKEIYQKKSRSPIVKAFSNQKTPKMSQNIKYANFLINKSPTKVNLTYRDPSADSHNQKSQGRQKSIKTTQANSPFENRKKVYQQTQTPKNNRRITENFYLHNNNSRNITSKSPEIYNYTTNNIPPPNIFTNVHLNQANIKKNNGGFNNFFEKTLKVPNLYHQRTNSCNKIPQFIQNKFNIQNANKIPNQNKQKQSINKPPLPKKFNSKNLYQARLTQSRVQNEDNWTQINNFPKIPLPNSKKNDPQPFTRNRSFNSFHNEGQYLKNVKKTESILNYNQFQSQQHLPHIIEHSKSSNDSHSQKTFCPKSSQRNELPKDSMLLYQNMQADSYQNMNQSQYKVDWDPQILADIQANVHNK